MYIYRYIDIYMQHLFTHQQHHEPASLYSTNHTCMLTKNHKTHVRADRRDFFLVDMTVRTYRCSPSHRLLTHTYTPRSLFFSLFHTHSPRPLQSSFYLIWQCAFIGAAHLTDYWPTHTLPVHYSSISFIPRPLFVPFSHAHSPRPLQTSFYLIWQCAHIGAAHLKDTNPHTHSQTSFFPFFSTHTVPDLSLQTYFDLI